MKALVYTTPGKVELHNISVPHANSDEVIVRVQVAGICGSDMGGFLGHHARRQPPLVLGHEMVGVVEESSQEGFPRGKRVAVNPLFSSTTYNTAPSMGALKKSHRIDTTPSDSAADHEGLARHHAADANTAFIRTRA